MNNLNLVYFSPTGTTKKVVKTIAQTFTSSLVNEIDLSPSSSTSANFTIATDSLTIIGVPVYSGRIPRVVVDALSAFKAKGSPVVLLVVYGNRAFDDALLELSNITEQCGFNTIGAAAFIGEHSYSTVEKPIAHSRPDEQDLAKCLEFGEKIDNKLTKINTNASAEALEIPGNFPYREYPNLPPLTPETISESCDKCGICADVCPTSAIRINDTVETDSSLCIWCCACVKQCPQGARIFENPTLSAVVEKLQNLCKERKEPEFFL